MTKTANEFFLSRAKQIARQEKEGTNTIPLVDFCFYWMVASYGSSVGGFEPFGEKIQSLTLAKVKQVREEAYELGKL